MTVDWTPEALAALGNEPDAVIARMVGGIVACYRSRNWAEYDRLLGTMIDQDLAEIADCTPQAVGLRRRKLGIVAFRKRGKA